MKRAIILNGAPGAGKDTIGCIMADTYEQVRLVSFKSPMFQIAKAMLGETNYEYFLFLYEDRRYKEEPADILNGKSPRQFMIWISEEVIKPQFGNDYFGLRAAQKIKESDGLVVIIDGGFPEETQAIINQGIEVKLCRIHREGCTFAGDSRSHLHMTDWIGVNGYEERDFHCVDGFPEIAAQQIGQAFAKGYW